MDENKVHAVEDEEGAEAWLRELQWTEKVKLEKSSMRAIHWGITCRLRTVTTPRLAYQQYYPSSKSFRK